MSGAGRLNGREDQKKTTGVTKCSGETCNKRGAGHENKRRGAARNTVTSHTRAAMTL